MLVLGIETTCDETGVALVRDGAEIASNIVASSADLHKLYGGVFPELACRRHADLILPLIDEALEKANVTPHQIDLIAVAHGPGLVGALLIGMQAAKGLSIAWNKPLVGINHVEAHLYAAMMYAPQNFPALGLVLSGGHTLMIKIQSIGRYELMGTTADDAIGEAFDKVATLLGLPYPGGAPLEQIARKGDPKRHRFRAGKVKRTPLNFSFSGLKTNVLYTVQGKKLTDQDKSDIAASFQETALRDLTDKVFLALQTFTPCALYFGGGVCNNQRLRTLFAERFPTLPQFWPPPELTLDNAAMIAGLAYHKFLEKGLSDPLDLEVRTRIPF